MRLRHLLAVVALAAAAAITTATAPPVLAATVTPGTAYGLDVDGEVAQRVMFTEVGASNVGTAGQSCTAVERGSDNSTHRTILTCTSAVITVTDATTAGAHGSHLVYTFPAGGIVIEGAIMRLTTLAGAGGIADTAALVGAIGSVTTATDNATLTSTEADWIASYAGTLTGGAGILSKFDSQDTAALDGTSTAAVARLNVAVPDAGMTDGVNDTLTVSGTIELWWRNVGDLP